MSKVFQHTKHVALWNECITILKRNPTDDIKVCMLKELAMKNLQLEAVHANCFACGVGEKGSRCSSCPLIWTDKGVGSLCGDFNSPYHMLKVMLNEKARIKNNNNRAVKLCEQIRDRPIREGVKYK